MNILKIAFEILAEAKMIGDISSQITINLDKLQIWLTTHGQERLYRHENDTIKESEIVSTVKKALQPIFNDFVNGKIVNHSNVLITNSSTNLNVVGELSINKQGSDSFEIITVMKKKNFAPKPGTVHYTI